VDKTTRKARRAKIAAAARLTSIVDRLESVEAQVDTLAFAERLAQAFTRIARLEELLPQDERKAKGGR